MKRFSKFTVLLTTVLLTLAFVSCKQAATNEGKTLTKLEAPTNLVINSITDNTISCAVNVTFNYNGKFEGATNAILGYSSTNDSSKASYDTYNSTATVEAGEIQERLIILAHIILSLHRGKNITSG